MEPQSSRSFDFVCYGCGAAAAATPRGMRCPACGEPFSIRSHATPDSEILSQAPGSMWHYLDLLPIQSPDHVVTLGEGATPLIDAPRLAQQHGLGRVLLKNEM
ncbi:MAG: hypothetical protein JXR94_18395, partial [Candidatus Hydrogenedentes bacterium]|nr:hypothetical protein [Candidatus Hydrogenedentota bacterium]